MAGPYYVRSTDGSDADSGLTWALAKATLAGALAVAAAGERIWVSQVHAETQAATMTLTSAGTAASPIEILCGNDAAQPPTALATTATVTTTGASAIDWAGFAYLYGITFNSGTGGGGSPIRFNSTTPWAIVFDTCNLYILTSHAASNLEIAAQTVTIDDALLRLINTNIRLADNANARLVVCNARFEMIGGAFQTTATQTVVFAPLGGVPCNVRLRGVDLSLWGAGKSLVDVAVGTPAVFQFEQCKLGASVALTTGTNPGPGGPIVLMDNCDSADTQYRMQRHSYAGNVYSETTIVRTGGASDGTTSLSHKMVSTANVRFNYPLYSPEFVIWNSTTGASKTATVEVIHDSVTNLTDAQVWVEVEALTTSGFPLSGFTINRATNILATPADQTASSIAWTTTGLTNPNKQKLAVTFTPQKAGWFRCRVALAKASYTVYVDPLAVVS